MFYHYGSRVLNPLHGNKRTLFFAGNKEHMLSVLNGENYFVPTHDSWSSLLINQ
jgi:hypothetical protein